MKLPRIFAFALIFAAISGEAADLRKEIEVWRPGQEVPLRLLSYPDGKIEPADPNICGLADYWNSVRPYIDAIESDALLEEIIFDPRSAGTSFQASVTRLIKRRGLPEFSGILENRNPTRWEHHTLRQAFESPFARMSVAFISKDLMNETTAKAALEKLREKVNKGESWGAAYAAIAEENPDIERRKIEPQFETTLVTFLYEGWISDSGFSAEELQFNSNVPRPHLAQAISAGTGGTLISASEGVYLFYVFEIFRPRA